MVRLERCAIASFRPNQNRNICPFACTAMAPIKIYLGTQIEQSLAVSVLSYSIRQHTQSAVEITPLYEAVADAAIQIPTPRQTELRPRTPFTFQRFAIPQLCRYQGRAIYLDSDMLVFQDIATLWQQPFTTDRGAADLLSVPEPAGSSRPPQYSVMLLNCDRLDWDAPQLVAQLEAGKWSYEQFVFEMAPARHKSATLPAGWNDLERYSSGQTALVHYTDMPRQPWLSALNPLCKLWCEVLLQAIADNTISLSTVCDSVTRGWVRPSLLVQIENGIADPKDLPHSVLARDRQTFTPPHIWQRYLRHPALQGVRSRQWFSRAYAAYKALTQNDSRTASGLERTYHA